MPPLLVPVPGAPYICVVIASSSLRHSQSLEELLVDAAAALSPIDGCDSMRRAMSSWPPMSASVSADFPNEFFARTSSTGSSRRTLTMSEWPFKAAQCRGVLPLLLAVTAGTTFYESLYDAQVPICSSIVEWGTAGRVCVLDTPPLCHNSEHVFEFAKTVRSPRAPRSSPGAHLPPWSWAEKTWKGRERRLSQKILVQVAKRYG